MIFPEDYKLIGVKDCERRGEPIYFSTSFLLSWEGPKLYSVKSCGQGLLREAEDLKLLASGKEIAFFPNCVDTRNRTLLIDLAAKICQNGIVNTVIFQGPDEHITFVKDPEPSQILTIEVIDVSPPSPPWLVHVLENLESCGAFGDLQIRFKPKVLDIKTDGEETYYPCRASGLGHSLDSDMIIHEHPKIVGCEISLEIFLAKYVGKDFDFINICPINSKEHIFQPEGPFITRCCKSERRGLVIRNDHLGIVVHWGDGPWRICEAIRYLVQELRK